MPKETPGIEFPLDITGKNSGYDLADIQTAVRFNVKNVILTNPGERIMLPDFGVGIKEKLFELSSFEMLERIQIDIREQMSFYVPYVDILDLSIDLIDEQSILIRLTYEIDFVEILDSIEIEVSNI